MGNFWTTEPEKGKPKFVMGQVVKRKGHPGVYKIIDIREFDNYEHSHNCWYYYEAKLKGITRTVLDYETNFYALDGGISNMLDDEFDKLFDD